LAERQVLDGASALPGFSLDVNTFFAKLIQGKLVRCIDAAWEVEHEQRQLQSHLSDRRDAAAHVRDVRKRWSG
jgi:hypothetical protein